MTLSVYRLYCYDPQFISQMAQSPSRFTLKPVLVQCHENVYEVRIQTLFDQLVFNRATDIQDLSGKQILLHSTLCPPFEALMRHVWPQDAPSIPPQIIPIPSEEVGDVIEHIVSPQGSFAKIQQVASAHLIEPMPLDVSPYVHFGIDPLHPTQPRSLNAWKYFTLYPLLEQLRKDLEVLCSIAAENPQVGLWIRERFEAYDLYTDYLNTLLQSLAKYLPETPQTIQGIGQVGNSCYLASALQILMHVYRRELESKTRFLPEDLRHFFFQYFREPQPILSSATYGQHLKNQWTQSLKTCEEPAFVSWISSSSFCLSTGNQQGLTRLCAGVFPQMLTFILLKTLEQRYDQAPFLTLLNLPLKELFPNSSWLRHMHRDWLNHLTLLDLLHHTSGIQGIYTPHASPLAWMQEATVSCVKDKTHSSINTHILVQLIEEMHGTPFGQIFSQQVRIPSQMEDTVLESFEIYSSLKDLHNWGAFLFHHQKSRVVDFMLSQHIDGIWNKRYTPIGFVFETQGQDATHQAYFGIYPQSASICSFGSENVHEFQQLIHDLSSSLLSKQPLSHHVSLLRHEIFVNQTVEEYEVDTEQSQQDPIPFLKMVAQKIEMPPLMIPERIYPHHIARSLESYEVRLSLPENTQTIPLQHLIDHNFRSEISLAFPSPGKSEGTHAKSFVLLEQQSPPDVIPLQLLRYFSGYENGLYRSYKMHTEVTESMSGLYSFSFYQTSPQGYEKACQVEYEIQGVIEHIGQGMNSGHYISYVSELTALGHRQWFECNDSWVFPSSLQRAVKSAYLIFLRKKHVYHLLRE